MLLKILLGLLVILTVVFYPKAYFMWRASEGLMLDCQCYGMASEETKRDRLGKDPISKKMCYGIPRECKTQTLSWIEYVKSDWSLMFVLIAEVVLIIAFNIANKHA